MDLSFFTEQLFKHNGLNPFVFGFLGMSVVFAGLIIMVWYIAILPQFLQYTRRWNKMVRYRHVVKHMKAHSNKAGKSDEIMAAVAIAIHLHKNLADLGQKITATHQPILGSNWVQAGRVQQHTILRNPAIRGQK